MLDNIFYPNQNPISTNKSIIVINEKKQLITQPINSPKKKSFLKNTIPFNIKDSLNRITFPKEILIPTNKSNNQGANSTELNSPFKKISTYLKDKFNSIKQPKKTVSPEKPLLLTDQSKLITPNSISDYFKRNNSFEKQNIKKLTEEALAKSTGAHLNSNNSEELLSKKTLLSPDQSNLTNQHKKLGFKGKAGIIGSLAGIGIGTGIYFLNKNNEKKSLDELKKNEINEYIKPNQSNSFSNEKKTNSFLENLIKNSTIKKILLYGSVFGLSSYVIYKLSKKYLTKKNVPL